MAIMHVKSLQKNIVSIKRSLRCYLSLVPNIPAAENASSASTDVGGRVSSSIVSVVHCLMSEVVNNAISALIVEISCLLVLFLLGTCDEIFNPEFLGLEQPNPRISGLKKCLGLESLLSTKKVAMFSMAWVGQTRLTAHFSSNPLWS